MMDQSLTDKILLLWGKTDRKQPDSNRYHPAVFHMIDVAMVSKELLTLNGTPRYRQIIARNLEGNPADIDQWLPWLIALHDIGKISAAFQSNHTRQAARLLSQGFSFGDRSWDNNPYHAHISAVYIQDLLSEALQKNLQQVVAEMCMAHHGRFTAAEEYREARRRLRKEPSEWSILRISCDAILRGIFLKSPISYLPEVSHISGALVSLTGLTVFSDWLASDEEIFTTQPSTGIDEYVQISRQRATAAIKKVGLNNNLFSNRPGNFRSVFPNLIQPRPLQLAIDKIPEEILSKPCLAIIEAPTGEGKTEAALALIHRLAQNTQSDEFYYALPTTATSNQMFARINQHLTDRLELNADVRLVHGQAYLYTEGNSSDFHTNGAEPSLAQAWLGNDLRKAMLMPFGVGTVDQAELAALNVRFSPLRLLGLAGKVVVFDEVHAYDVYMTTIIERLLHWLATLGSSVILLSATLPLSRRERLIEAYGAYPVNLDSAYPSLVVVNQEKIYSDSPNASQLDQQIELILNQLSYTEDQADLKARWLVDQVSEGGCACWITNTVARAQQIVQELVTNAPPDTDVILLHSRFPLKDRQRLEQALTSKYGPSSAHRPKRGIVVGTQVLEQSLDLDFDVMASDLAPIDLLLQRAGRLHRHLRPNRPTAHNRARFWINSLLNQNGDLWLEFADTLIYDEYFLYLTWNILSGRSRITLPEDYRPLIEYVYSANPPDPADRILTFWKNLQAKKHSAWQEANQRILPTPDAYESISNQAAQISFEEDENKAAWIIAQTRLAEEGLTIIPMEHCGDHYAIWPGNFSVPISGRLPQALQREMMRSSLRISHTQAVHALKAQPIPEYFKESSLIKNVQPVWMKGWKSELITEKGILTLRMDAKLGLVIE